MVYILILTASNGEKARLEYATLLEARAMQTAFMRTGDYINAQILTK